MLLGGRSAHPGGWAGTHPHVLSRVPVHPPGLRRPDQSTNVGSCQGRRQGCRAHLHPSYVCGSLLALDPEALDPNGENTSRRDSQLVLFPAPRSAEPHPAVPGPAPCRGDQLRARPIHGQTADKGSDNSRLKSCVLIDAGPRGPPRPPAFSRGLAAAGCPAGTPACAVALVWGMESLT